ncbi:DUF4244 domain-containing protein [Amorphoplanes digitatis]|uniref:DUF4244 domain-containing protein n=1 Tax=Actinoplanes digitatis TaxID=1868 RepID=UPI001616DD29|nr:DUF4244 domain-containing protein [Actinoplanes digitatis]
MHVRRLIARLAVLRGDEGMNTAEYAVGTLAAVAFAGVLYKVVSSPGVQAALTGVINEALK